MHFVHFPSSPPTIEVLAEALKKEYPDYKFSWSISSAHTINKETGKMERVEMRDLLVAKNNVVGAGLKIVFLYPTNLVYRFYSPSMNPFKVLGASISGKQKAFRKEIMNKAATLFNGTVGKSHLL